MILLFLKSYDLYVLKIINNLHIIKKNHYNNRLHNFYHEINNRVISLQIFKQILNYDFFVILKYLNQI